MSMHVIYDITRHGTAFRRLWEDQETGAKRAEIHPLFSPDDQPIYMDLPPSIKREHFVDWLERGQLIQHVFHQLSVNERELLKTGLTTVEWDDITAEPEDEEINLVDDPNLIPDEDY